MASGEVSATVLCSSVGNRVLLCVVPDGSGAVAASAAAAAAAARNRYSQPAEAVYLRTVRTLVRAAAGPSPAREPAHGPLPLPLSGVRQGVLVEHVPARTPRPAHGRARVPVRDVRRGVPLRAPAEETQVEPARWRRGDVTSAMRCDVSVVTSVGVTLAC